MPGGKRFSPLHFPHSILKCSHPKTASSLRFISCSRFWVHNTRSTFLKTYVRFNYVEIGDSAVPMRSICFEKPFRAPSPQNLSHQTPQGVVHNTLMFNTHITPEWWVNLYFVARMSEKKRSCQALRTQTPKKALILYFIYCVRFRGTLYLNSCSQFRGTLYFLPIHIQDHTK